MSLSATSTLVVLDHLQALHQPPMPLLHCSLWEEMFCYIQPEWVLCHTTGLKRKLSMAPRGCVIGLGKCDCSLPYMITVGGLFQHHNTGISTPCMVLATWAGHQNPGAMAKVSRLSALASPGQSSALHSLLSNRSDNAAFFCGEFVPLFTVHCVDFNET